jgi:hypothetical protein
LIRKLLLSSCRVLQNFTDYFRDAERAVFHFFGQPHNGYGSSVWIKRKEKKGIEKKEMGERNEVQIIANNN